VKLYTINLPFPSSANHQWKIGHGHIHLSAQAKAWRKACEDALQAAGLIGEGIAGRCRVKALYRAPDNRKRDVHNLHKPVFDVMQSAGFWLDDSQVAPFSCDWDRDGVVQITPYTYKPRKNSKPRTVNGGALIVVEVLE